MTSVVPRIPRPHLDTPHRRFGDYIRQVRQAKRLALRACAERIGLAPGHLSNIENGRAGPPAEPIMVKLAEVLEVPIGALLARSGRLGPADLHRFWSSPLIPSLVMSSTGWSESEAKVFQETVLASLPQSISA
jgi:transcriptional regulator with XRE-family HTH domain